MFIKSLTKQASGVKDVSEQFSARSNSWAVYRISILLGMGAILGVMVLLF